MRVILKVWSSNHDYSGGADYAAVEMTEELAKLTLRRMNSLGEQKALDAAVYETNYWDSSAEYFSPRAVRQIEPDDIVQSNSGLEEILDRLEVDIKETVKAPLDFQVPAGHIVAVECAQMTMRDGGIVFTALLRHSDIYLTTAEVPREIIEAAFAPAT